MIEQVLEWLLKQPPSETYVYQVFDLDSKILDQLVLDLKERGYTATYTVKLCYIAPEIFQEDCPTNLINITIKETNMNRITADQARGYPKPVMESVYAKIHEQVEKRKRGDVEPSVFFDNLNPDQIDQLKKDGYNVIEWGDTDHTNKGNCTVDWR